MALKTAKKKKKKKVMTPAVRRMEKEEFMSQTETPRKEKGKGCRERAESALEAVQGKRGFK